MPPRKKTTETDAKTDIEKKKPDEKPVVTRTIVRVKDRSAWAGLLKTADDQAWRKLKVVIQVRDKYLAGKPAKLDVANAMLKARKLEDKMETAEHIEDPEERQTAANEIAKNEGKCEFVRRPNRDGVWVPSNNFKAGLKENWSVLGLRKEIVGSRGALAEGLFVVGPGEKEETDWIYLGTEPSGIHEAVAHTDGPQGPKSSLKRHEYMMRPLITFYVIVANAKSVADKISDDDFAKTMVHWQEHGTGACRSQGFGRFDVVSIEEVERGEGAIPVRDTAAA